MYQSAASSQAQGQLKKSSGRSKPLEVTHANEKGKKSIPIPGGATNRAPARRPAKFYNKQVNSGGREKTFSKNERKLTGSESRHYMERNPNDRNEEFVVQSLLNFQYTSGRNIESNNSRRYQLSRRKKTYFNKEEYLQAKCQFVVIGSANDYFVHAADPDKLVEWDQIQLVYLPSHDPPNCPICLYSPVAAKMTRCGHIFCWSCILHYLHLSDKAWRKCPICHEAVNKSDLKSVKCNVQKRYERLDSVTMKLMRRAKDSVFAMPMSESQSPMVEFSSWIDHASNSGSKIMLASPEEVLQHILIKERNELRAQLDIDVADENGEDAFISMALQISEETIKAFKLKELKELPLECVESDVKDEDDIYDVDGNGSNLSAMLKDTSLGGHVETAFSDDESGVRDVNNSYEDANLKEMPSVGKVGKSYLRGRVSESSISSEQSIMEETRVEEITSGQDGGSVASSVSSDYTPKTNGYVDSYYFYQADDGQNIFLHSLNARCLIEEYGTLDCGPLKITGQIIDFECFTMTKELRKRFRYLSHLPLSSEFMICELILRPPLLSKNTIHNFMLEFKNRKAMRLKKFKEQQKFDRRATNAGNKQHGFRSVDYDDDDDDICIDLSNTADFPSGLSPEAVECDVKCKERKEEPGTQQQFNGPSFAQMLNKKSEEVRKEHVSMPTVVRTYRARETIDPSQRDERMLNDDDDGPEIVAPDFKQTFSAAMFAAPMKQEGGQPAAKGKNGKKKKEKGMLLFATGGQRKY